MKPAKAESLYIPSVGYLCGGGRRLNQSLLKMGKISITIEEEKPSKSKKHRGRTKKSSGGPPICGYCGGTGKKPWGFGSPCPVCGGKGVRPPNLLNKCHACGGTGRDLWGFKCTLCGGWGYRQ